MLWIIRITIGHNYEQQLPSDGRCCARPGMRRSWIGLFVSESVSGLGQATRPFCPHYRGVQNVYGVCLILCTLVFSRGAHNEERGPVFRAFLRGRVYVVWMLTSFRVNFVFGKLVWSRVEENERQARPNGSSCFGG